MARLSLLLLLFSVPAARAENAGDVFYSTYNLARHAGIRHEVAEKIAHSRSEFSGPAAGARLAEGLRMGNLKLASSGLPPNPREALGALVEIRARLPIEALDCELDTVGSEPNCLSPAPALADSFPASKDARALARGQFHAPITMTSEDANDHTPPAAYDELEGDAIAKPKTPSKAPPNFLGPGDAWSASELLGEQDFSGPRSFFDTMYGDTSL